MARQSGMLEVGWQTSGSLLRPLHLKQSSMWNELAIDASVNAWLSVLPCDKLATCPQQEIHFACRQLPEAPAAQMTEVLEGGVLVVLAAWGQRRLAEIAVLGEVVSYGSMLCWSWRSKVSVLRGGPTETISLCSSLNQRGLVAFSTTDLRRKKKLTEEQLPVTVRLPQGDDSGFVHSLCDKLLWHDWNLLHFFTWSLFIKSVTS